jgi:hypothetical protein
MFHPEAPNLQFKRYAGPDARKQLLHDLEKTPAAGFRLALVIYTEVNLGLAEADLGLEIIGTRLESILTEGHPEGFFTPGLTQNKWEEDQEATRGKYQADKEAGLPLILLFPGKGHRVYTRLLNNLKRAGFTTVEQVLANQKEALTARGIDLHNTGQGKMREAVQAIINYFSQTSEE